MKMLLIGMPAWNINYPWHSLGYVGGIIKNAGWHCRIEDLNIKIFRKASKEDQRYWFMENTDLWQDEQFVNILFKKYKSEIKTFLNLDGNFDYDIIAFTVNKKTRYLTLKTSSLLKSLYPQKLILFGGPDCFPSEHNRQFFCADGSPNIICQGEAEIALPNFLNKFKTTGDYRCSTKGFIYADSGIIIDNGEPDIPSLENEYISPDWSQIDFASYIKPGDFPTFFSRGCTNRCVFCRDSPNFKRYRTRKATDVFHEIKESIKYTSEYSRCPTVIFSDSLLNGKTKQLEKLCDLIIESRIKINWQGQAKFNSEMTYALLEKMANSGCNGIWWGLESASQNVINLMGKNFDIEIAKRVIIDANKLGIMNKIMIIVGFPGETFMDFLKTLLFVINFYQYSTFCEPEPCHIPSNSHLHYYPQEFGIRNKDMYRWTTDDGRNNNEIRKLRAFILKSIINNDPSILNDVSTRFSINNINLNHLSVASETAGLIYELWKTAGIESKMGEILTQWDGETLNNNLNSGIKSKELTYWHPYNIPKEINLINWFCKNKNTINSRTLIVNCLFAAVKLLKRSVN